MPLSADMYDGILYGMIQSSKSKNSTAWAVICAKKIYPVSLKYLLVKNTTKLFPIVVLAIDHTISVDHIPMILLQDITKGDVRDLSTSFLFTAILVAHAIIHILCHVFCQY